MPATLPRSNTNANATANTNGYRQHHLISLRSSPPTVPQSEVIRAIVSGYSPPLKCFNKVIASDRVRFEQRFDHLLRQARVHLHPRPPSALLSPPTSPPFSHLPARRFEPTNSLPEAAAL